MSRASREWYTIGGTYGGFRTSERIRILIFLLCLVALLAFRLRRGVLDNLVHISRASELGRSLCSLDNLDPIAAHIGQREEIISEHTTTRRRWGWPKPNSC
jgi:hypothetical protein